MTDEEIKEVDERILQLISSGVSRFSRIHLDEFLRHLDFRVIDRRLQSLRKRDRIFYTQKDGWKIKEN